MHSVNFVLSKIDAMRHLFCRYRKTLLFMGIAVFGGRNAILLAEEPLQVAEGESHLVGRFGNGGIGLLAEDLAGLGKTDVVEIGRYGAATGIFVEQLADRLSPHAKRLGKLVTLDALVGVKPFRADTMVHLAEQSEVFARVFNGIRQQLALFLLFVNQFHHCDVLFRQLTLLVKGVM